MPPAIRAAPEVLRRVGMLTNGNEYHNRYAWIFEIRDDKIYALREYMDSHYILQQLKML